MAHDYDDNVNDVAFEDVARDKSEPALANSTLDTVFQKAIVIDVITDPAAFRSQKDFDDIYNETTVDNFAFIKRSPRNSIIARVLNDGQGKRTTTQTVSLPFFPPHLCFPIKPGEHVWLISPAPIGKGAKVFYWMCRVPTWLDVDDLNYTHEDRIHHYVDGKEDQQKSSDKVHNEKPKTENVEDPVMYGFPNGNASTDGYTIGTESNQYDIHVTGSLAYKSFKFEPVPRLTKMPGDMVMQGSNNTSITLGTTRGYKGGFAAARAEADRIKDINDTAIEKGGKMIRSSATIVDPTTPESPPDLTKLSAAIDIVAGRSIRTRSGNSGPNVSPIDTELSGLESEQPPTFPRLKKTVNPEDARGANMVEVSKNPQGFIEEVTDNQLDHAIEGDPDFRYDASRIYLTADSSPDADFGLTEQLTNMPIAANPPAELDGAAVVVKSDHIRIIARKDPDDIAGNAKVNGSIRIIKEGIPKEPGDDTAGPPDNERAVIAIEPSGTIIIDGPRVVLGNNYASGAALSPADQPYTANDSIYIGGDDAQHSIFLAEELADTLMAFAVDILRMHGAVGGNAASFGSGGKNPSPAPAVASTGNSGAPIINATSSQPVLDNLKSNLLKSMSKVIKIK